VLVDQPQRIAGVDLALQRGGRASHGVSADEATDDRPGRIEVAPIVGCGLPPAARPVGVDGVHINDPQSVVELDAHR
jgi:hypothetical protein